MLLYTKYRISYIVVYLKEYTLYTVHSTTHTWLQFNHVIYLTYDGWNESKIIESNYLNWKKWENTILY